MAPLFGLITADFFLLTSDGQNLEEFTKLLTSIFKDLFTFTMFMGEMYGHLTTGAYGIQKRLSDLLELRFLGVEIHPV